MLSYYCLKCRENTESKSAQFAETKNVFIKLSSM